MWVLVFSVFFGFLTIFGINKNMHRMFAESMDEATQSEIQATAMLGSYVMSLCEGLSPGVYSQATLLPSTPKTPSGNAWVCAVTNNGARHDGTAIVLYMDGPPQVLTQWGTSGQAFALLQENFTRSVVGHWVKGLSSRSDWVVGMIASGDSTPYLVDLYRSGYKVSLSGRVSAAPFSYITPVIASGVIKAKF